MKRNVGTIDRVIRLVLAIGIGIAIATHAIIGTVALIAGIAAGILLITSLVGFCGIYAVLGFSTCPIVRRGK